MSFTHKVVGKIMGDKYSKNNYSECFVCGKDIDYPTYRHGKPLCDKCAKRGDKNNGN